jgi:hypothetical protein
VRFAQEDFTELDGDGAALVIDAVAQGFFELVAHVERLLGCVALGGRRRAGDERADKGKGRQGGRDMAKASRESHRLLLSISKLD